MPHPSKPWTDGQQHELYPGKVFQYSASNNRWVRVATSTNVSDSQLDSEIANIKAERDSDLVDYITKSDHDSDLNNLNGDYGAY